MKLESPPVPDEPRSDALAQRITLVIPCWNRQEDLDRLVASLHLLTELPRILVIDDFSDPPIRSELGAVVRLKQRVHRSVAKNVGLSLCESEIIWFLDSDTEILEPSMLETALRLFDADEHLGALGCEAQRRNDDELIVMHRDLPDRSSLVFSVRSSAELSTAVDCIPTNNMLVRSDALRLVGGFCPDIDHHEDKLVSLSLRELGYELRYEAGLKVLHHLSRDGRAAKPEEFRQMALGAAFLFGVFSGPTKRRFYWFYMLCSRLLESVGYLRRLPAAYAKNAA